MCSPGKCAGRKNCGGVGLDKGQAPLKKFTYPNCEQMSISTCALPACRGACLCQHGRQAGRQTGLAASRTQVDISAHYLILNTGVLTWLT